MYKESWAFFAIRTPFILRICARRCCGGDFLNSSAVSNDFFVTGYEKILEVTVVVSF